MKTIIKNLEKQKQKLEDLVSNREDYVLRHSEQWQESEKFEDYEDKTKSIEEQITYLDNIVDELKELL